MSTVYDSFAVISAVLLAAILVVSFAFVLFYICRYFYHVLRVVKYKSINIVRSLDTRLH